MRCCCQGEYGLRGQTSTSLGRRGLGQWKGAVKYGPTHQGEYGLQGQTSTSLGRRGLGQWKGAVKYGTTHQGEYGIRGLTSTSLGRRWLGQWKGAVKYGTTHLGSKRRTVCTSLTHSNRNSPPSSLSCTWNWPSRLASEGCVDFPKVCTIRQPEKVGTVSPSSDTRTTHVTLVKVPCCRLSYTYPMFSSIVIFWFWKVQYCEKPSALHFTVKIQILHSK